MPVFKYRDIADMPPLPLVPMEQRAARIRSLWERAHLIGGGVISRGVLRFRSIDDANSTRTRATLERMGRRDKSLAK